MVQGSTDAGPKVGRLVWDQDTGEFDSLASDEGVDQVRILGVEVKLWPYV